MATPNNAFATLSDDVRAEIQACAKFGRALWNSAELASEATDEYPQLHADGAQKTDDRGNAVVSPNTTRDYYNRRCGSILDAFMSGPVCSDKPATPRKRAAVKATAK